MLRVGLTGDMGSGKSTVARLLAAHGAIVLSSDEIGRAMMQPGQPVYDTICAHFGPGVMLPDGQLDRPALARLAFDPEHPRVEELNAIVHPAVLAEQDRLIFDITHREPGAIVVIESALIFTTRHAGTDEPWRKRFDRIVVVTAPEQTKVTRFMDRALNGRDPAPGEQDALRKDGLARLARQQTAGVADFTITNDGGLDELTRKVAAVWDGLRASTPSPTAPPDQRS